MPEFLKLVLYYILAIGCYVFVACVMHIEKKKLLKFMAVLALFMSVLLMSPVYSALDTVYPDILVV